MTGGEHRRRGATGGAGDLQVSKGCFIFMTFLALRKCDENPGQFLYMDKDHRLPYHKCTPSLPMLAASFIFTNSENLHGHLQICGE